MVVPDTADALAAAARLLDRAVAALLEQAPDGVRLASLVAGVVEAAGGPDTGNAARTRVEREPADLSGRDGAQPDQPGHRVLTAALGLARAADADLRSRLTAAGLGGGAATDPRRVERAAYAERTLTARLLAVETVLASLAQQPLAPPPGPWHAPLTRPL